MTNFYDKQKGIVLLMVLGTLLVVTILASIILNIILNQSRLTHHQVSRIQAYYAAMAGVNFALEQLRTGSWSPGTYTVSDSNFPHTIQGQNVNIDIYASGTPIICPGNSTCVNATVNYTYSP